MMQLSEILERMQLEYAKLDKHRAPPEPVPAGPALPAEAVGRNQEYDIYRAFFTGIAPHWLKEHRRYFSRAGRGFGEDAFHAMWFVLFRDLRPRTALEIGVYRGQVVSLWALLSYNFGLGTDIHGISPFSAAGDSVSSYDPVVDYYRDTCENVALYADKEIGLHKGFSTDPDMVSVIRSRVWDVIYIDGNHDHEVVRQDFENCRHAVRSGGVIVFDDSSLYNGYKPASYSSAGHPGPSMVADAIPSEEFKEIIRVGHNRVFRRK